VTIHEHNDHALFALFYTCRFCIHGERRMWVPSFKDELASCVVLVLVLHDILWN